MSLALTCLILALAPEGPAGPDPEVPELRVLSRYLGDWTARSTFKPTPEAADGPEITGTARGEWVLGGRFLQQSWKLDPNEGITPVSGLSLMTYDPARKTYLSWAYVSTGSVLEAEGKWSPETRTMTWTGRDPATGETVVTTSRMPSDGVETWSIARKGQGGQVGSEMSGRNQREKK